MKITALPSLVVALLAVAVAMGCATSKPKSAERLLTEAGFKAVSATTPQQHQQLETLAAGHVSPVKRNGQVYYVYPDRALQQLYVGQETAYRKYQKLVRAESANTEAQMERASRAENEVIDRALRDHDSTPGFEGPGGFDF
jgi:hypothetical protein